MLKIFRQFLTFFVRLPFMTVDKPGKPPQEAPAPEDESREVIFYSSHDTNPLDPTEINAVIQHKGFAPFPESDLRGGGGGVIVTKGKMIYEGGGYGFGGNDNNTRLMLGMGGGHFHLGYIIAQNRLFQMYPLFGPGALGGGVRRADDGSEVLGVLSGKFDVGMGVNIHLKIFGFSMIAGFQVGYTFGLGTQETGVSRSINKPFFRVIYGGGRR